MKAVVFAYHTMGVLGIKKLLAHGFDESLPSLDPSLQSHFLCRTSGPPRLPGKKAQFGTQVRSQFPGGVLRNAAAGLANAF